VTTINDTHPTVIFSIVLGSKMSPSIPLMNSPMEYNRRNKVSMMPSYVNVNFSSTYILGLSIDHDYLVI
jgi:hypothetical protein